MGNNNNVTAEYGVTKMTTTATHTQCHRNQPANPNSNNRNHTMLVIISELQQEIRLWWCYMWHSERGVTAMNSRRGRWQYMPAATGDIPLVQLH
jgi:hypothetical protein